MIMSPNFFFLFIIIMVKTVHTKNDNSSALLKETRRILRGHEVGDTRPYMVYLRPAASSDAKAADPDWLCGGVIIHERYVLTSAACIEDVKQFYVVSGTHRLVSTTVKYDECVKNGAKKAVWKCVPKAYYFDGNEFDNIRWMINDIAVVKVEDNFNFDRRVRGCDFIPKKISYNNQTQELEKSGTVGSIAGWGSTDHFGSVQSRATLNSPDLLETDVVLISKKNCKKRWESRYHYIIDNNMICAKDGLDIEMSSVCSEHEVNCKDLAYSEEDDDLTRRKQISDPEPMLTHSVARENDTRRSKVISGGFCENDHGGPLVVGQGKSAVVIGVISACMTKGLTHKCHGPFLYTSVYRNRNLIDCAINKDIGATCRGIWRSSKSQISETVYSWASHPDGPAKSELHRRRFRAEPSKVITFGTTTTESHIDISTILSATTGITNTAAESITTTIQSSTLLTKDKSKQYITMTAKRKATTKKYKVTTKKRRATVKVCMTAATKLKPTTTTRIATTKKRRAKKKKRKKTTKKRKTLKTSRMTPATTSTTSNMTTSGVRAINESTTIPANVQDILKETNISDHTHVLNNTRRIILGTEAGANRPYMVYLKLSPNNPKYKDYRRWLCGGVIIHDEYILTSAACIEDVKHFYVVSGMIKYDERDDRYSNMCIKNGAKKAIWKCIPRNYIFDGHENDNLRWMNNDIAIVKVEDDFDFTRRIRGCDFIPKPIDYNNDTNKLEEPGTMATIAGWGSTYKYDDTKESTTQALLEATVQIISKARCKKRWGKRYDNIIDNYMICSKDLVPDPSEMCQEKYVDCTDIMYSAESEEVKRRIFNPDELSLHSAHHNDSGRRQGFASGGFCENDHGGPLIYGTGVNSVVIGIISACLVKERTNKCYGPFLYTSVYRNRILINCAIYKDLAANCDKMFRSSLTHTETEMSWTDHPDGPAKNEIQK